MHFRKKAVQFLSLTIIGTGLLLLHQNCSNNFDTNHISSSTEQGMTAPMGGNGDGYDGKLYVVPGSCNGVSTLQTLQDRTGVLNSASAIIQMTDEYEKPRLRKENCKELSAPKDLNISDIVWLKDALASVRSDAGLEDRKRLKYKEVIFWNVDTLNSSNEVSITINSNQKKLNLLSLALSKGWKSGEAIHLIITETATIYSDDVTAPALNGTDLPLGTEVYIENRGSIFGAMIEGKPDKTTNQAYEGGVAVSLKTPTLFFNSGKVIGGAGSGGMHDMDRCCSVGNGGSKGGQGGSAIVVLSDLVLINSGSIFGGGGGGASGGGAWSSGIASGEGGNGAGGYLTDTFPAGSGLSGVSNGGDGGDYGLPGNAGGDAGNGGNVGGEGGYAIELHGASANINGQKLVPNSSLNPTTWMSGFKGRILP